MSGHAEVGVARVALTATTAAELVVDTARLMTLGTNHHETALVGYAFAKHDIGTTAGNVGGEGDGTRLAGAGDNLSFALVVLRVQRFVPKPCLV